MMKVVKPLIRGGAKGPSSVSVPSKNGATHNAPSNIKVVVRVRPPNDREMEANSRLVIDVVDERMLVFDPKEEHRPFFYQGVQQPNRSFLKRANKELKFVFDHICDINATNKDVFEMTTKEILASLMDGYNCSVFVYGATGAGKTFTMIGSLESPGITYLTMEHLFYSINSFEKDRDFEIGVSYLEVYNENVFDLLKPSKTALQLREDSKYGVMVAGLTLNYIKTAAELLCMLENGNKNRTQHPTDANAESSRSHAVFQVYIKMCYKISGQVRLVKLSMIDLAGSERASATGCVGERFKEGANINRSLLSLGNCINKLADGSSYIPYRDSKLTRLLKDSLGGNCRTVMIANISPSSLSFEDSYNTLKYAARASKIQHCIKKNIVDGDIRMSQMVKVTEELKKKVKELEAKLALSSVPTVVREVDPSKEKAKQEWRRRIEEEEKSLAPLERQLLSLMSRARVLALRRRLRARAFRHVAGLAHRSSTQGLDQMSTEDIPREERAAEHYIRQSVHLDSKIQIEWTKWHESTKKMQTLCEQAVTEHRELEDFVKLIQMNSRYRQIEARDGLRYKVALIEHEEILAFTRYMSDMPGLLRQLYLTLKGYDHAPPALAARYLDVMRQAKAAKSISWSDDAEATDPHIAFIASLELDKPSRIPESIVRSDEEIKTESDTDVENVEPMVVSPKKRKGTPIKLANNETIIIDDSFENLDITKTLSSKKMKRDFGEASDDIENYAASIDPKDLNSTFVLAGKMEALKRPIKQESVNQPPPKRGLMDRTNTMQRSVTFNDKFAASKPKPVGKTLPFKRPATAPAVPKPGFGSSAARPGPGFGSSLGRDGAPLQRNIQARSARDTERSVGLKAVRARDRPQAHPYSRPPRR